MTINDFAQYVTVAATIGGGLYFAILEPLKAEIKRLGELITEMGRELEDSKEDRRNIDSRLARLEQSDKSAHKRLERIEDIVFSEEFKK